MPRKKKKMQMEDITDNGIFKECIDCFNLTDVDELKDGRCPDCDFLHQEEFKETENSKEYYDEVHDYEDDDDDVIDDEDDD